MHPPSRRSGPRAHDRTTPRDVVHTCIGASLGAGHALATARYDRGGEATKAAAAALLRLPRREGRPG